MPWITLTEDHIVKSLSALEASALRTLQLEPGAEDPLIDVLKQTVNKVHGYVATRYAVGQPGTIPDQLLASAIAIGRWLLIGRLPVKALATEIREGQYDDALAELLHVTTGKFKLSVPTAPATEQPGATGGAAWGSAEKI